MTPEFGAATQLEKIDMLDFADLVAINKFDKRGALDALRDVKKQYMRNNNLWDTHMDDMPVFGTIASQFNDPGMNSLYKAIMDKLVEKTGVDLKSDMEITKEMSEKIFVIPPARVRYLSEIAESNRAYDKKANDQVKVAQKLFGIYTTIESITNTSIELIKTGLNEDEIAAEDFTVYPNPAVNQIEVRILAEDNASYQIHSMLGQVVKVGTLNNKTINVSNLKAGMYILQVNDGDEILTKKFVKK